MNGFKGMIRRSPVLSDFFERTESGFRSLLYDISPEWLAKFCYWRAWGRLPDYSNPITFDEKLQWLMLFWRHPLKTRCADKFEIRSYATESGLAQLLPEIYGLYESTKEIDFGSLPTRCVLKCTHGSGFNIFQKGNQTLDEAQVKRQLNTWLKTDISRVNGEVHYSRIKPRIMLEQYLDDGSGKLPNDYKFYCFAGDVHCVLVCSDRDTGKPNFDIYDREWKKKLPYSNSSLKADRSFPMPNGYSDMLSAAEILSYPFPFVRVDFYSIGSKPVLGEMTFTPNGCVDTGYTPLAQKVLGDLVILPEKYMGSY